MEGNECDNGLELLEQGRGKGDVNDRETSLVNTQCCCHLSAAQTATDPKATGIFLQQRQEKRFERLGRMVAKDVHEECTEDSVKRRVSDVGPL